ncbi:putative cobalt transporter subunit (CbtA) [Actinomadura rubteroloni]|uniref:Putative cobalt transporter subunit (CbtA) n=1 Tax=Actinomadura rubteroloni TaxID=1926885 RepID=A0A2P4UQJ4_9ACTN|nr:CbtA family protein [Actinomadura rubteroloni]POM27310.1 putative cobalt transporter subunit (CbtA) [Actinomadura rubteroloni]
MERHFIVRGMAVGAIGGLLAFLFARIFAEPQIQKAIDYESGRHTAQSALDKAAGLAVEHEHAEPFSRAFQGNVGIGVGIIAFGIAMGALYAVAYALACGRTGKVRPRTLALLVAGGGFLALYLIPFAKYPANPPAIGHEDTIRERSGLYLLMVGISIVVLVAGAWLGQRLQARFGTWNATLLAVLACAVVLGAVMLVLPSFGELSANVEAYGHHATETPLPLRDAQGRIVYPGFPADTLFAFRFFSVAAQAVLWGTIGLCFAPLAERLLGPRPDTNAAPATV